MAKIKNLRIWLLDREYEGKFQDWLEQQTPLARSTDKLLSTSSRLEQQLNDEIYARLNPFHRCGRLGERFMEETFGYITERTFFYREGDRRYVHDDSGSTGEDLDSEGQAS
jgi:hypothetical protein